MSFKKQVAISAILVLLVTVLPPPLDPLIPPFISPSSTPWWAPTISSVTTPATADTTAYVEFRTDVPARCFVDYGLTTSYGSATFLDSSHYYRQHIAILTGLAASTPYNYRITCVDNNSNQTVDGNRTLTTSSSSPVFPKAPTPVDPNPPDMSGVTIRTVRSSAGMYTLGQFQNAINDALAASGKQVIEVEAGQTVTGNFSIGVKVDSNWIEIRSSAYTSLPAARRVVPGDAASMFKITSANVSAPLQTSGSTARINLVGAEVTIDDGVLANAPDGSSQSGLIRIGTGSETAQNQLPSNIRIDRCWIHGLPKKNTRRGVYINGEDVSIVDSYLNEFHDTGSDAQAILVGSAKRILLLNNYAESAGENFMAGGVDQTISGYASSDFEIRNNVFPWLLNWKWNDPTADGYVFTADAASDTLTSTSHGFQSNYQPLRLRSTGTLPAPLTVGTDYFVRSATANTLKLGQRINFTADPGTNTFTAAAHGMPNDLEIRVDTNNSLPAPLNNGTNYYVINQTVNSFQLATSVGGGAIDVTSAGTGTHYVRGGNSINITDTGTGSHFLLIDWVTKNNFEIKKGERVLLWGNSIGPWWESEQTGGTISFKSSNDDPDPVVVARDIFVFRNRFPNVGAGIVINGSNNVAEESTDFTRRVFFFHDLFELDGITMSNEDTGNPSSGNISFISTSYVSGGTENYPDDLIIRHTTFVNGRGGDRRISNFNDPLTGSQQGDRFIFQDNVLTYNVFGLKTGGTPEGTSSLDAAMNSANYTWSHNLIAGVSTNYPGAPNLYVTAPTDILFVNYNGGLAGGDFRLTTGSPGHNTASDSTDRGADIDALERATESTINGDWHASTVPGGGSKLRGHAGTRGKGAIR